MRETEDAIEIPHGELSPETLRRVAEEFVTRDGTDYGAIEKTLEEKVERLLTLLREGRAKLYFEAHSQTVHIVPSNPRASEVGAGVQPRSPRTGEED